jgi:hypothetical protein
MTFNFTAGELFNGAFATAAIAFCAGWFAGKLQLEEGERQMLLMALAHLAVERPGWDDALNRIAVRIDNVKDGRAVMYDEFRAMHRRELVTGKQR